MSNVVILSPDPLTDYENAVHVFIDQIDKGQKDTVDSALLETMIKRDQLQKFIETSDPACVDLIRIFETDRTLYAYTQLAVRRWDIDPGKWRYILRDKSDWWWKLDKRPVRRQGEITYEDPFPMMFVVAVILFGIGLLVMLFTTQQLWSKGLDLLGYANLGFQLLIGGGLISDYGQKIALRLTQDITRIPAQFVATFRGRVVDDFPLASEKRPRAMGLVVASVIFLLFVVLTAILFLPSAANLMHRMGVDALQRRNLASAQIFLDLSLQLQPNFMRLVEADVDETLVQLALIYQNSGELEKAQATYEQALANDTSNVLIHFRLADIYHQTDQPERALNLLDQAVTQLDSHLAPNGQRLPISDTQARQILFGTLVMRGKVYLQSYEALAALPDLRRAERLIESDPDLFITDKNAPPAGAISTTELYLLLGQTYTGFYAEDQSPRTRERACAAWNAVQALADDSRDSVQRLWLLEANERISALNNCEVES